MFDAIANDFYMVDAETGEERGSVVIDEYDEASEDAYNNLIRGLIDANRDVADAKVLLVRALDQLYLLGYDSGFTNPAIEQLTIDIHNFLKERGESNRFR